VFVRFDHVALTDLTNFRVFPRNLQPELYALPSVSRHRAEVSATKERKKHDMKKRKKTAKIRDLKPAKDAKGGGRSTKPPIFGPPPQ
jgi:hypothetical protein